MIIAIAIFEERVSPRFDCAPEILLVKVPEEEKSLEEIFSCESWSMSHRLNFLRERKVEILICGALGRRCSASFQLAGIETLAWISGEWQSILRDLREDKDSTINEIRRRSKMPGGDGTGPMGAGPAFGAGRARGMGMRGRMGGNFAAGPGGECFCPACGSRQAHSRAVPCNQLKCPKCGTSMNRVN